jgi:hypothetical protein
VWRMGTRHYEIPQLLLLRADEVIQ